jgi:hypothetical protein
MLVFLRIYLYPLSFEVQNSESVTVKDSRQKAEGLTRLIKAF